MNEIYFNLGKTPNYKFEFKILLEKYRELLITTHQGLTAPRVPVLSQQLSRGWKVYQHPLTPGILLTLRMRSKERITHILTLKSLVFLRKPSLKKTQISA